MNFASKLSRVLKNYPRLKGFLLAIRNSNNSSIPFKDTQYGFKIAGPESMADGTFEAEETPIIHRLILANDIFINVGANVGYYCCFAAQASKPIIAFEPHPTNNNLLLRNLEVNGFSENVEIYPTAVGSANGILKLYGSGTAASLIDGWAGISSDNFTLAPVVTLDGVLSGRFKDQSIFILIDVEGAEYSVIQGSLETLKRARKPWWVVEICIADHQPEGSVINPEMLQTFDLISNAGYEIWTLTNTPKRVHRTELEEIWRLKVDMLGIHNFLCVEPEKVGEAINILIES